MITWLKRILRSETHCVDSHAEQATARRLRENPSHPILTRIVYTNLNTCTRYLLFKGCISFQISGHGHICDIQIGRFHWWRCGKTGKHIHAFWRRKRYARSV